MKIKLFKIITTILIGILSFSAITPTYATSICDNDNISGEVRAANGCPNTNTDVAELPDVVVNILYAIIAVSGLIAIVFVIVGGIQYMTSAGDPGKIKKAKDTILYAVIGLVICVLAFAIVNFTISNIIGHKDNSKNDENESAYHTNTPIGHLD